ncbi:hypothetical protein MVEN_02053700 [Mycena venus]|uniref:Uncharacterized protein n=1 Tax=Mycena venus TaxID=2733690 RepID=A0A8H6XBK1_9AGAR|nr:hypothetical protein MVEN_02053700 [Mycena venus]
MAFYFRSISASIQQGLPKSPMLIGTWAWTNLRTVSRDRLWLDDLLDLQAATWGDVSVKDLLRGQEDSLAESVGMSRGIEQEVSEAAVDKFAVKEADIANVTCHHMDLGPDYISARQQESTPLPSAGKVHPDMHFYVKGKTERLFERRENKTLEMVVYHAHELEATSENDLESIKTKAIRGILTQAYASSTCTKECCKVVWMGHPCLYRVAYIYDRTRFLSDWRSAEPERMRVALSLHRPWRAPIVQSHFIREILALASVPPDQFGDFLKQRRKPTLSTAMAQFVHVLRHPFDTLARILIPRLVLGDNSVHGFPCFLNRSFPLEFPETIKPRFVWRNEAVVAKAVGPEEFKVWQLLARSQLDGIPTLLGLLEIQTAPKRAKSSYL